ncbi:MAG TPA: methyltransferase domain-containing protein [Euzebyales bacterium]|nr:methyltransferase domain-containing protein [Euzebyales bacterium]
MVAPDGHGTGGSVDYDAIAGTYDRRYTRARVAGVDTHAGVERAVLAFAGDDPGRHVLEVGCGTGHWLSVLAQHGFGHVAGLDASAGMLEVAATKVEADLREGDAARLPWPDATFDRVCCIHALHHFPDKPRFVAEARRVLRSGGGLFTVGLDPHTGDDRWLVYDLFDGALAMDRRRYPPTAALRTWMADAGFTRARSFVAQHQPGRGAARAALAQGWLDRASTSQLTLLSDAAYDRGIARVWEHIHAAERRGETFELYADLRLYATVGWVP